MMGSSALRFGGTVLGMAWIVSGCGGADDSAQMPSAPVAITVADVGLATPESVLHDEAADVYLVSNVNGAPTDKDDNGFISRLSPDGELLELKWIDGATSAVTLNAPKGLAIVDDRLYVADIDCVRYFDRVSGAPIGESCVDGATFLNDVTPALDGGVLFTDSGLDPTFAPSGTDAIYRLDGNGVTTVIANPGLGAPNGILDTQDGALVVTFLSGEVFRVAPGGNRTVLAGPSQQQLDGIVRLSDGRVLISSWGDSCIYEMSPSGSMSCIFPNVEAPADIGADIGRGRVLIPQFNANRVLIRTVP